MCLYPWVSAYDCMYPIGCEVILTSRQCPVPSRSMTGAGSALGGEETSGGGAGAGEAAGAAAAVVVEEEEEEKVSGARDPEDERTRPGRRIEW